MGEKSHARQGADAFDRAQRIRKQRDSAMMALEDKQADARRALFNRHEAKIAAVAEQLAEDALAVFEAADEHNGYANSFDEYEAIAKDVGR